MNRIIIATLILFAAAAVFVIDHFRSETPVGDASAGVETVTADNGTQQGTTYTVSVAPDKVASGAGDVLVSIQPQGGYHWNKLFPAKVSLTVPEGLKVKSSSFVFKEGTIQESDGNGVLTLALVNAAKGSYSLSFQGDFSFCTDEHCRILRKETFKVDLKVE